MCFYKAIHAATPPTLTLTQCNQTQIRTDVEAITPHMEETSWQHFPQCLESYRPVGHILRHTVWQSEHPLKRIRIEHYLLCEHSLNVKAKVGSRQKQNNKDNYIKNVGNTHFVIRATKFELWQRIKWGTSCWFTISSWETSNQIIQEIMIS